MIPTSKNSDIVLSTASIARTLAEKKYLPELLALLQGIQEEDAQILQVIDEIKGSLVEAIEEELDLSKEIV